MKKIIVFVLFVGFSTGIIGCSSSENQSPATEKAPKATVNRSDSNSAANTAPGTTPPGDTEGKSDADKSGEGKSDADK